MKYICTFLICMATVSNFALPPCPTITATISGDASLCEGESEREITFRAQGGTSPYTFTYKINGGSQLQVSSSIGEVKILANPTNLGIGVHVYTLISVEDANNCTQILNNETVTITINNAPVASFSINPTHTDLDNPTIAIRDSSLYAASYEWDFGDGTTSFDANITSHTYPDTGRYIISLITTNGNCQSMTSRLVTITLPNDTDQLQITQHPISNAILSIDTNQEKISQLTPNPFTNQLSIQVPTSGTVVIRNTSGNTVYTKNVSSGSTIIGTKDFPSGIYFLSFIDKDGEVVTQKVMKE